MIHRARSHHRCAQLTSELAIDHTCDVVGPHRSLERSRSAASDLDRDTSVQ